MRSPRPGGRSGRRAGTTRATIWRSPGQGRFRHVETKAQLAVNTVAEWFPVGGQLLAPGQARDAWNTLEHVVAHGVKRNDWALLRLPTTTGLNLWLLRVPDSYDLAPCDPDIGTEIQGSEPQHRIENYVDGSRCPCGDCVSLLPAGPMEGFVYADGRFMYHAVRKELGGGPGVRMSGREAAELWWSTKTNRNGNQSRAGNFAPARYRIRVRIPDGWDHVGLLPVPRAEGGWHWPNRAGTVVEAWAHAVELRLVEELGWQPEILEGVRFTPSEPLRGLQTAITDMLAYARTLQIDGRTISPRRLAVVEAAVRQLFRVTVGAMARRTRTVSGFATDPSKVPPSAVGAVTPAAGGWVYQIPAPARPGDADTWHPEIASMVWAESRTRVLRTPTALVSRGRRAGDKLYGAWEIPPEQLIGIHGDAIYTTHIQDWTLPAALGGGDDGVSGRIRVKGYLPGPVEAPTSIAGRLLLSKQAESRGWSEADLEDF